MRNRVLALCFLSFTAFSAAAADRLMYCPIFIPAGTPDLAALARCSNAGGPSAAECTEKTTQVLKTFYFVLLASSRAGQFAFEKYSYIVTNCGNDKEARAKAMELMLDLMPENSPDRTLVLERLRIDGSFNFRNILQAIGTLFVVGDFIEDHYAEKEMKAFDSDESQMREVASLASQLAEEAAVQIRTNGLFPPLGGVE